MNLGPQAQNGRTLGSRPPPSPKLKAELELLKEREQYNRKENKESEKKLKENEELKVKLEKGEKRV